MEFTYTSSIYIQESDLVEMCLLCKEKGYSPHKAFHEVSMGWDDCDYYASGLIEDEVIKEIERRLKEK